MTGPPTVDYVAGIGAADWIIWDDKVWVKGTKEGNQIVLLCPFCYSSYEKDGTPRADSTRKEHRHGAAGVEKNVFASRGAHCDKERKQKQFNILLVDLLPCQCPQRFLPLQLSKT